MNSSFLADTSAHLLSLRSELKGYQRKTIRVGKADREARSES
jgi:hypothetical protein